MSTPAEIASLRTVMGLSMDALADALEVNPRTVRNWEHGRDKIGPVAAGKLQALLDEHTDLSDQMIAAEVPVVIPRYPDGDRPRGWFLAAAGRAMLEEPDLEVAFDVGSP